MYIKVYPGKLEGFVKAPPSKSVAHRALICAALVSGKSIIYNLPESYDIFATIDCLRKLGVKIERKRNESVEVTGAGGKIRNDRNEELDKIYQLDCRESGSTLRFLLPLVGALGLRASFTGEGKLPKRPLEPLTREMATHGVRFPKIREKPTSIQNSENFPENPKLEEANPLAELQKAPSILKIEKPTSIQNSEIFPENPKLEEANPLMKSQNFPILNIEEKTKYLQNLKEETSEVLLGSFPLFNTHPLPIVGVEGQLLSGLYKLPGDVSSQFISGLLFSLPLLDGDSRIELTSPLESMHYVNLTIECLKRFGIEIEKDITGFYIYGKQSYISCDVHVEGDYSNGAFFLVAGACSKYIDALTPCNALKGKVITKEQIKKNNTEVSYIEVENLPKDSKSLPHIAEKNLLKSSKSMPYVTVGNLQKSSKQGDKLLVEILKAAGGDITWKENNDNTLQYTVKPKKLKLKDIDCSEIPDLFPILTVAAAISEGITRFYNIKRLKLKESDRLSAMVENLRRLGILVEEKLNIIMIHGGEMRGGCTVKGYNDHRIVMAMAVAALFCNEPIKISDAYAVAKSYPNFFKEFTKLGGKVDVIVNRQ